MSVATQALLWRHVTLFDGLQTWPTPMAVRVEAGRIVGLWPEADFQAAQGEGAELAGKGGVLTPGLVDCHTHLVHAGQRAGEFEQRLEGTSYAEIARAGGGILGTVRATRAASEAELFAVARTRLQALIDEGVATVEIKSGYGLTVADELKLLRVARRLGEALPVRVITTLLGAHAVPPEFQGDADGYVDLVCREMIPAAVAEGLADAVDVFCEGIAFSPAQCERVFLAAREHGLPIKAHAEQLSNLGGSAMAARLGALSADHVEYLDEAGVRALAAAGTVAVLLPGAFLMLGETQHPPVELLRRYGVPMALASDANPGTSPLYLPTLIAHLGCTLFRLTPREALAGMTAHAAQALGRPELGRIQVGAVADLCLWDVGQPAELAYEVRPGRLRQRVFGGEVQHVR
ncbi:Imidazolonepropionase [Pseudomonas psychrotolerans L19]|uniref:imidazolonepropionase n=1 Tax=Pseudomonas TaxID=286 RepID=UPI00023A20C8|nr:MULTISPECIES: imidazolonepropionase [Pseudomonas]EHK72261.1 Imidazolonepropionase [Pseudomonas psychrotolerans L19]MBA1179498.1 imidazolonepropionase [Pseudomonas psychrotolerans]MBA1214028.1 imidazolonepropionase [Pseudomonas psychrotolerans]TCQ91066.1 imidazolonepropionase [Pseudomonas sp. JUb52]